MTKPYVGRVGLLITVNDNITVNVSDSPFKAVKFTTVPIKPFIKKPKFKLINFKKIVDILFFLD